MVGICKPSTGLDRKIFLQMKRIWMHTRFMKKQIRIFLLIVQVSSVAKICFEYWRLIWRYALLFESIFAVWVKQNWKRCAQFLANLIFSCSIWSQNDKTVAKMGNIANCTCVTLVCPLNAFSVFVPICNVFSQSDSLQSLTTWDVLPKRWKSWRNIFSFVDDRLLPPLKTLWFIKEIMWTFASVWNDRFLVLFNISQYL